MHSPVLENRPWWKEPMVWLIIILPLSAVIAGSITLWLAAKGADVTVDESYFKEGLAVYQADGRESWARSRGITAILRLDTNQVLVQLTDSNGLLSGQAMALRLLHPADAKRDERIVLSETAPGAYAGQLNATPDGKRRFALESNDGLWRIAGIAAPPFDRPILLGSSGQPGKAEPGQHREGPVEAQHPTPAH